MEGKDGDGIGEGELMEDFFDRLDGHGKEEHFRVVHGAEEFLELGDGGDDGDISLF